LDQFGKLEELLLLVHCARAHDRELVRDRRGVVSWRYDWLGLLFFIKYALNLIKFPLQFLFNFRESRCFFHILLLNFFNTLLNLHGLIALHDWIWGAVEDRVSLLEWCLVARLEGAPLGRVDVRSFLVNYLFLFLLAFSYRVHLIDLILLFFWCDRVKIVCAWRAFLKSV
jgi:hypothetical protein